MRIQTDALHLGTNKVHARTERLLRKREHLEWWDHQLCWRSYYHFVWPHESLDEELSQPVKRKGKQQLRLLVSLILIERVVKKRNIR